MPKAGYETVLVSNIPMDVPKGSILLYSTSHPILGITKAVFQTANAAGDGSVEDGATQFVWEPAP